MLHPLPENKEVLAFRYDFVQDNLNNLLGQVLTVVDASVDGEKNKAVKDLIREKFHSKMGWFGEVAHSPKDEKSHGKYGYPFEGMVVEIK